jgi:hypothetical protein
MATKARQLSADGEISSSTSSLDKMDDISFRAEAIDIAFKVQSPREPKSYVVGLNTRRIHSGDGLRMPPPLKIQDPHWYLGLATDKCFSEAIRQLARACGRRSIQYETLNVSSIKCPTNGKRLRDLVLNAIAEAFNQRSPSMGKLASAVRLHRTAVKRADAKRTRRIEKRLHERLAAEIKLPSLLSDFPSLILRLEKKVDQRKLKRAVKMLKAERFQLYADVSETSVIGIIKSQTNKDLIYSCWMDRNGRYACCTQNLNLCGGLRGGACKHVLALIIGLAKAGKLDLGKVDSWAGQTRYRKSELNKELMSDTFIRYKGADAGEVDWRPTETVPEDYYAV